MVRDILLTTNAEDDWRDEAGEDVAVNEPWRLGSRTDVIDASS